MFSEPTEPPANCASRELDVTMEGKRNLGLLSRRQLGAAECSYGIVTNASAYSCNSFHGLT